MAITKFTDGEVIISGETVGDISAITVSIDQDVGDVSVLGKTWKEILALGKGWTMSGTIYNSTGDTGLSNLRTEMISGDGVTTEIRTYEDTVAYFKGAGIFTNFTYAKTVGGVDVINFSLTGDSALSYSTA